MKKKLLCALSVILFASLMLTGCLEDTEASEETEALRVQRNISQQADNFNIVRKVTVIDCITGDTLFQMDGRMSIIADTIDNQLEVLVETDDGNYCKHIIGLNDNVTYVVEDLGENEVNKYN